MIVIRKSTTLAQNCALIRIANTIIIRREFTFAMKYLEFYMSFCFMIGNEIRMN